TGALADLGPRARGSDLLATVSRRARGAIRILRLKPYDASTIEGRAQERYRRAMLTSAAGLLARVVTIATAFVSVPLTVGYLGTERYGMWLTLSSALAFGAVGNYGIGSGLLNAVSRASAGDDRAEAQRYISSAFAILLGCAIIFGAIFCMMYERIDWAVLFNVKSPLAAQEAKLAVTVGVICWLVGLVVDITPRVYIGYQAAFANELW